jgi:uncharacterized protein
MLPQVSSGDIGRLTDIRTAEEAARPERQGNRQGRGKVRGEDDAYTGAGVPGHPRRDGPMNEVQLATRAGSPVGWHSASPPQPGSQGEHLLQEHYGTTERARQFYDNQLSDQLTPEMIEFIGRMEMAFVATSDATGECDCSFRAGKAGFMTVVDERTIAYPEYRGNGVMASLGNIIENQHVGILMVDFTQDLIGLHVNGAAQIVTPEYMLGLDRNLPEQGTSGGTRPIQWVLVRVIEAYIHCSKHIPKLVPQSRVRHWGTDNPRHKGGDYFAVAARKAASAPAANGASGVSGVSGASGASGCPPGRQREHAVPPGRGEHETTFML